MILRITTLLAFSFFWQSNLWCQAIDTDFGKNRIQYHDDFKYWSKYETQNFITYWYGKSSEIGKIVAQIAEYDHDEIRKTIEHKISDKIEILVYVDLEDLKQSNLGSEEAFESKSGETKIVGNKMFVYFDGNHLNLRNQIREGIASVYFSAMMFGSNFQEIIQNAVLLEVPEWFAEGIVAYAASNWNIFIDDELRDILYRDPDFYNFKKLSTQHPRVAGHALWFYVSQHYGKSVVPNLLYLTRISRDIENAFDFVLNTSLSQVFDEASDYFKAKYDQEKGVFDLLKSRQRLDLSNKPYAPVSCISLSPSGKYLAYAHNDRGKIRVVLRDLKTEKEKRIFKIGYKNVFQETDYGYPDIVWNKDDTSLSFTYQHRDKLYLCRYNMETEEFVRQLLPEEIQRVYSLDYFDERYYIMSAATDGYSDLYIYDTKQRQIIHITEDFYDDLDVAVGYYNDQKGIYFSSNRVNDHILPTKIDTLIPVDNFDIFFLPFENFDDEYDLKNSNKLLDRITSTPEENERFPQVLTDHLVYLNDKYGVINSFVINKSDLISYPITNSGRNTIRHTTNNNGDAYYYMLYNNGAYEVHKHKKDIFDVAQVFTTSLKRQFRNDKNAGTKTEEPKVEDPKKKFITKFEDPVPLKPIREVDQSAFLPFISYPTINEDDQKKSGVINIINARILAAGLRFKIANVTTRLDNDVLFEGLELFDGQNQRVNQLPMGILAKATVNDLFEDYSFEGGMRFPTSFNGSEYFMIFDNKKDLIDKRIAVYRRVLTEDVQNPSNPFVQAEKEILLGMHQWSYPFDVYSKLRATALIRLDRNYFNVTDDVTFNEPVIREKRIGAKLEYVFDNSFDYKVNIKHGSRAKVYVQAFNEFNINVIDGFDFEPSNGFTAVLGYDARHYIPLLRESLLAFRSAGAFSFGSKPNVFLLGDVNNTVIPSFDQSIPLPTDRDFAFKTNVNHLRGFSSNARNGSTFLLANAELRVPFLRYFLNRNEGSSFFRDFHLVGFLDAGLAWFGANPYSEENALNRVFVDGPTAQLEVTYYRDPLILGYGFGLRTTLLGYFLRLDYAWGFETRTINDPRIHFSFGYDF